MKRHIRAWRPVLMLLAVLIALTVLTSGCAATPKQRLALANETYTATLTVLSDLRDAGQLSAEQARQIEPYRQAAAAALDVWSIAVVSGDPSAITTAETKASAALDALIARRLAVEGKH